MRYLNCWDNKNFFGAKSGPLTHASSVIDDSALKEIVYLNICLLFSSYNYLPKSSFKTSVMVFSMLKDANIAYCT